MGWNSGQIEGTWFAGTGKNRRDMIGPTVYFGPRGQRYIIRKNKFRTIFNIPDGYLYTWGNWDGVSESLTELDAATEQDWAIAWQTGLYQGEDSYEVPEYQEEPDTTPNLSYLKDNRTELTAAAIIAAIVLIVVIAKA